MKLKTLYNFFFNFGIFGTMMLCSIAFLTQNAAGQNPNSRITVDKSVCDSIGDQNTCNGRINNLEGQTINFTVYDVTGIAPGTPPAQLPANSQVAVIGVVIREGNGSQGSTTQSGFVTGREYLVCETVPNGYDTLPRPDQSSGGSTQSREGDCIRFTAISGNNVLQFINYLEDLSPTAALAKISGKVVGTKGKPVSRAKVVLTDQNGVTRTVTTDWLGNYEFDNLPVGQIYVISAFHRKYVFTPKLVSLVEDLTNQNLVN